jgi:hypothetical protein
MQARSRPTIPSWWVFEDSLSTRQQGMAWQKAVILGQEWLETFLNTESCIFNITPYMEERSTVFGWGTVL